MPFPAGVQTVTLTGHQTLADGAGRPLPVRIRPVPRRVVGPSSGVVVDNDPVVVTPDAAGQWTVTLLATDASGFTPTGWTYRVETGGDALYVSLPHTLGTVDLAELTPAGYDGGEYVLVPGPPGADGRSAYQVAVAAGFVGTEAQWLASLVGPKGDPGTGGGAVATVNGITPDGTGNIVLDAAGVGADPAGAAAAAQSAAVSTAAADATSKVSAHTSATDPHGDRAAATAALNAHTGATTGVHGIADTAALETQTGAQAKADAAQSAATTAASSDATAKVSAHAAAVDPHGDRAYADSSKLAKASNLSDVGNVATARSSLGLGGAAILNVGTAAGTVAAGDDSRLSNARTPTAHAASHATGGTDPITPAAIGALSLASYGNIWTPADHGLTAWTFDPASCSTAGTSLSAGFIYLVELVLRQAATLSKVHAVIGTAGSGLTSGQCLAGLYDTAGNRVATTADMSTTWNSAGNKTMNLTASYSAAAGRYYVALLFNGTTSPVFACGSTLGAAFTPGNANLTAGSYRFCRSASGQTALPATVTLSGYTPDANNVWAGAS